MTRIHAGHARGESRVCRHLLLSGRRRRGRTKIKSFRNLTYLMPKKLSQSPSGSFFPPNDHATYRDLLLFEERLKTNALILNRRKSRYQSAFFISHKSALASHITLLVFLAQLIFTIIFLLCEVLLNTAFLSIPYQHFLRFALPKSYGPDVQIRLHPYVASGLLFVSVTTLLLFFATGLYSEKIGYANRCGHDYFLCNVPIYFMQLCPPRKPRAAELQYVPEHASSPPQVSIQPILLPLPPSFFSL
jgi:Spo7-like protein